HNIPIGNPKDLAGFMRKLAADRHFAMEFWAFIGTLSSKEKGELTDDQMLSVILEGVVGGDIPEDDWSLNGLVSDLANLLAGIDVPNPTIGHDFELPPTPYTGPAP